MQANSLTDLSLNKIRQQQEVGFCDVDEYLSQLSYKSIQRMK